MIFFFLLALGSGTAVYGLHAWSEILPTVAEVGICCFSTGVAIAIFGAKIEATNLGRVGDIFAFGAIVISPAWWFFGPFSVAWIIAPALMLSISVMVDHIDDSTKKAVYTSGSRWSTVLFLGMTATVAYLVPQAKIIGDDWPGLTGEDFCAGEVSRSSSGNLLSDKLIPLRAVARLPNVRLSHTEAVNDLDQYAGIMRPWLPYYVFEQQENAWQIAETDRAQSSERRWIQAEMSFCWTTRECINVEQPMPVYGFKEDAASDTNPLERDYTYRYREKFLRDGAAFEMACLPILDREDHAWAFVRPEGTASDGYQVAWLSWDESSAAEVRIRVTRREMDEYIIGLQTLLIDYRNPELRTIAKEGMYESAADFYISSSERDRTQGGFDVARTRLKGIPVLYGFPAEPPENDLEVGKIRESLTYLLRYMNRADNWDANEVAYPLLSELP
jgi:hypothetical protein